MPRNGSGTYTLPESPFVPGTTISSSAVNDDFSDIALALTSSLATDGQSTMTGPIKAASGSALSPTYTFSADTDTGMFSIGDGQIGFAANGVLVGSVTSAGFVSGGASVGVPVGMVADYGGSSAPSGWLLCFGQAIDRTTYATLFGIIGITYGNGNGVSTFNVPDLRGRVGFGKDDMGGSAAGRVTTAGSGVDGVTLGAVGGAQNGVLSQANLPNVTLATDIAAGQGSHTHIMVNGSVSALTATGAGSIGPDGANFGSSNIQNATLPQMTGTTPLGGSGTAVNKMPPTQIMNKIIYTGV